MEIKFLGMDKTTYNVINKINYAVLCCSAAILIACSADGELCEAETTDCNFTTELIVSDNTDPVVAIQKPITGPTIASEPIIHDGVYDIEDINTVVVVTGQSNVEGSLTTYDPYLDHPDPRVFAFTDSGWQVADLHQVWDINAHPGNHALTDPTRSPNNNFVFHFGKSLAQIDPEAVTGFIVLAAPGRGISHWDYDSLFYQKIRNKINNAILQLPQKDNIDVMLWHQGESDAQYEGTSDLDATGFSSKKSIEYINYYQIKLKYVIDNFRSEPWAKYDMPFICGETRISYRVNRRLLELNEDSDPNTACVYTTDLPYRLSDPSGAHFSAEGLRMLGERYMRAYLDITN